MIFQYLPSMVKFKNKQNIVKTALVRPLRFPLQTGLTKFLRQIFMSI